ncbi:MAG: hypothetical protein MJZ33_02290 [Paludibacteraceae bacterium]|nr:hypothetical protein [Paludibacteraceae bacterium]
MRKNKRIEIERRFSIVEKVIENTNYKNMEEYFPIAEELEALINEFSWIDIIFGSKEDTDLKRRISITFHKLNNIYRENNKEFYESANI